MKEFEYIIDDGKDIDMTKICGCPYARTLDKCEQECKKYYDCQYVAIANDILVAYEKCKGEKKKRCI